MGYKGQENVDRPRFEERRHIDEDSERSTERKLGSGISYDRTSFADN